jgi:hypothetical protein
MDLRKAFEELDADAITAAIDKAFPCAVAVAVQRHVDDGTIAALSTDRRRPSSSNESISTD